MGKVKRRITPNDVVINIGKNAPIPECPIPGERYYCSKTSCQKFLKENESYELKVIVIF